MDLLLDTHTLIWTFAADASLDPDARDAIVSPQNRVFVSAASIWEMSIKRALGKLRMPDDVLEQIDAHRFEHLAVTSEHAWHAGGLPRHHADPFDRMLVAQALLEAMTVVTRDDAFDAYGVSLLPA